MRVAPVKISPAKITPGKIAISFLLVFLTLGISGCGKRARHLDPPDSPSPQYPKRYPPNDTTGAHL